MADDKPVTEIVLLVMVAFVVLFGVAACATTGDGASSSSVSFDTWDGDPDWSPDGRLIAFASNRGSGGVFVVRPDGTAVRRVFSGEASDVDWSRDGTAIAFTGSRGIYVLRLGDRRAKRVLRGSGLSLPAWAPNGRDLTVVKEESGRFRRYGGAWFTASYPAIYTVRLAGGVPHRLLPPYRGVIGAAQPNSVAARSETEPAWSPDGKRIALQAGDGVIVVADVRSGRRTTIRDRGCGSPAWSPNGRLIAYQCVGNMYVAGLDGTDENRVASEGGDPSWSPDSRLLVFEHYLYGGSYYGSSPGSLSIVDANGDGLRRVTFGPRG